LGRRTSDRLYFQRRDADKHTVLTPERTEKCWASSTTAWNSNTTKGRISLSSFGANYDRLKAQTIVQQLSYTGILDDAGRMEENEKTKIGVFGSAASIFWICWK
jgi:hypothetical protein